MFNYKDMIAFIVRLSIFLMILSGYPLMHYFVGKLMENLFFAGRKVSRITEIFFGVCLNLAGLSCTIFYPNVGSVLAYLGAIAGFLIIYSIPVFVHLSQLRAKIYKKTLENNAALEASISYEQKSNEKIKG